MLEGATAQLSLDRDGAAEQHVTEGSACEPFGRGLAKKYWQFEEGWVNLNHGQSAQKCCDRFCLLMTVLPRQAPTAQRLARSSIVCTPSKLAVIRLRTASCASSTNRI